jgi:neutral ceramidase
MRIARINNESKIGVSQLHEGDLMHKIKVLILIAIGFISICGGTTAQTKAFRASVVKVDITPDDDQMLLGYNARKSTGVHDRIYHRIVCLDDGTTQFFLVSTDLCELSPSMYDLVAAQAEKELGIKPMNWWWTNTHTHSAPECGPGGLETIFLGDRYKHEIDAKYTALVGDRLVQGLRKQRRNWLRHV